MVSFIRTYKCRLVRVTLFRQQYFKIGNTREQLFHVWRSFNFDENTETIDTYATCISQVATLLGYGEPQNLEVFKNTLPINLYWILFPVKDLRQAMEIAKRILTQENLDKGLSDRIDKLMVMIGKLAAKESEQVRQFKPQIHQNRGRGQNRGYN